MRGIHFNIIKIIKFFLINIENILGCKIRIHIKFLALKGILMGIRSK